MQAKNKNILQNSILTIVIALFSFYGLSQPGNTKQSKKEKIEQLKIAFITKELDFSTEEAEKFWPVYNDMSDALKAEKKSRRTKVKELKANFDSISENEIKKKAIEILDSEISEAKLKKEYTEKIAEVIGYKKAVQLLRVEKRFKMELLKKLNEGQGQNRSNRTNRTN